VSETRATAPGTPRAFTPPTRGPAAGARIAPEAPRAPAKIAAHEEAAAEHQQAYSDRYAAPAAAHAAYQHHEAPALAHDGNYAYDEQGEYDEQYDYADQAPLPRKRYGMWAVAAVLGVAVVGTAGAVGYRSIGGSAESQVPVIKADAAPAKLVPPAPAREPTRTASLDVGARGQGERLVSKEEQPVDLDSKLAAARANASNVTTGTIGSSPSMMALASAPSTAAAEPSGPKKVKTIAIRPDGSPASPAAAPNRIANASDTGMRPADPSTRLQAGRPGAPLATAPEADAARPSRSASLGPNVTSPAAPAVPAGTHMVQLASQKSESDAQAAYRTLQSKYPNILGSRQASIKRVEIADKGTFYRAQVGPFASGDQAGDFCNSLKAVGGQCIVQRN
jgi:hypothetical protein